MSNVSNSPVESHGPEALTTRPAVYVLPMGVYSAFTATYPLSDVVDFTKLRSVLSLDDVAQLEVLRTKVSALIFGSGYEYVLDSVLAPRPGTAGPLTTQNVNEIQGSVNLLVKTSSVVAAVEAFLAGDKAPSDQAVVCEPSTGTASNEPTAYRVVILHDAIYILVEEGFRTYLEKPANRLAFLTRVLKSAYAIYPIRMVNSCSWYQQYLRALAA